MVLLFKTEFNTHPKPCVIMLTGYPSLHFYFNLKKFKSTSGND